MHPPNEQTQSGPNQRFASTTLIGSGHSARRSSMDRTEDGESRNEGRRSRRASYDAAPMAKKQRFEILKKLGSGTYGKVSLALDHRTGEEVAVKVIKKSAIENTADLIRIRREIRIMSALKHPHITEIKEVFENDEKIILVMEYASGGELYDYVSSHGPLSELEVRRLFRQIVSAVYYCHKHGVAHRDLKLENILLDRTMDAKIADFGLSNYFKPHSLLHTFCGSPLYASPEIINGTPYRGPEVDCWSLGVLLYTLAYSSMPFDGRDFNRMIRQIKRGAYYEPDPPSSASMLIRCMLRVNPDRRYDIAAIAGHWWLNFDENAPSIADLQENQVIDSTPLYIRQETLMIQSLGEEAEVFAEYTHLSEATKKKIEEFRRRKKEENWYLTDSQSPVKKQAKRRSSSIIKRQSSQTVNQTALAAKKQQQSTAPSFAATQQTTPAPSVATAHAAQQRSPTPKTAHTPPHQATPAQSLANVSAETLRLVNEKLAIISSSKIQTAELMEEPQPIPMPEEPPAPIAIATIVYMPNQSKAILNEGAKLEECPQLVKNRFDKPLNLDIPPVDTALIEEANRLINQLMEEALKGPVSPDLVESIRTSEAYEKEPFVKDILESVLIAQLPKPFTTPSTINLRASRSRPPSMTRMAQSASTSMNLTPLPDTELERPQSILDSSPQLVDLCQEINCPFNDEIFTSPTAQLTVTLAHRNVMHQTVPEDEELELSKSATELARQIRAGQSIIEESEEEDEDECEEDDEEKEEDVYSTDFEDMEEPSSEDEQEIEKFPGIVKVYFLEEPNSAGEETDIELAFEETVPITTVDSFVSLPDSQDELDTVPDVLPTIPPLDGTPLTQLNFATTCTPDIIPTIDQVAPISQPPALSLQIQPDVVVRRGLAKRISRGKYERTKFTFGREISITDSPKMAKRRIGGVQPQPKDAPKLFQKAKQYILQYPDPERLSPERERRRRYSDGDMKKDENDKTSDKVKTTLDWMKNGDVQNGANLNGVPSVMVGNEVITCENERNEHEMVALSAQRRQERERARRIIMDDYSPTLGCYIIGVPDNREPEREVSPNPNQSSKKRTYVTADEAKSVGAIEPSTLQVAPKRRQPSVEPLLDILEAGGGQADEYDGGTAAYGIPRSPVLVRPPSNNAFDAELRRHSYRSAMEDSLNSSQEGDAVSTGSFENILILPVPPPLSPPPIDQSSSSRARYTSPTPLTSSTASTTTEPYWMQYLNRDDNHRHHTPTSYSTNYGGEYSGTSGLDRARVMSPTTSSYERNDDDYYASVLSYAQSSYRSRSVFTSSHSREMSPAQGRSLMSPLRTVHTPDTDAGYGYSNRSQKAKSWYTANGHFEEAGNRYSKFGPPKTESSAKRNENTNTNTNGMANYFRSFFDVAYNRIPRLQDQRYEREREKTPVSSTSPFAVLKRDSSLKRRSRSCDKSQLANRPSSDIPTRRHTNYRNSNYMPDDRVDVSSHTLYTRHDTPSLENLGGAGKFGSLLYATPDFEKMPSKGILKKQSTITPVYGQHYETITKKSNLDTNRPMNFLDRLRRHLSTEKPSRLSEPPPDIGKSKISTSQDVVVSTTSKTTSKKRSLLQMARRKTIGATGMFTNGNDSGFGSGSISSDDYYVSSSANTTPIEKLKGFFGANQSIKSGRESTPTAMAGNSNYYSYQYTSGTDKGARGVSQRKSYQTNHRPSAYVSMSRY